MNRLDPIIASTRRQVAERRASVPEGELERAAAARSTAGDFRPFADALAHGSGPSLIAEHKRRSPSAGVIRDDLDLIDVVGAYERGGASALSILTETDNFGGSLDDLKAARAATGLPILRKDFVVERYQLLEAVAAGADAVLLIVAALERRELEALHVEARELGLAALVEVHDARELATALEAGAEIVGINNRDLTTLKVDIGTTLALAPNIPQGRTIVAESGFTTRAQLDELADAGVDAVLVGEALMRAADVESACRALTTRPPTM
jgi:indole-3-glycerol phosphate synthase